jgi:hypothetical protein
MKKIIFLSILISFLSCKKADDNPVDYNFNTQKEVIVQEVTVAQKLAVLDTEYESGIDVNDPRVEEIQKHLLSLSKVFNQSEDVIGNSVFILNRKFKEKGVSYSNIETLRVMDNNVDAYKGSGMSFEEFCAMIYALTNE